VTDLQIEPVARTTRACTSCNTPIDDVIAKFGLRLRRQGRELVGPCPRCGGRDRFAVNLSKQLWNCRGCSRGGDAIALVRHVEGCSYRAALVFLDVSVGDHGRRPAAAPRAVNDDWGQLDYVERIWGQATALGQQAVAYFERRGILINEVPDHGGLRWHSACPWEGGTKPCVVGRYTTSVGNEQRGIWRRPIDGSKPKALGPTASCVIRLWPDEAVEHGLVLGEGIETTLAAATRIEHRGTLLQPAWAAGSAGNMANFPVLSEIEALTILVDNDAAGERAADQCRTRWKAAGCEVTLLKPNISNTDFNDVVLT
jgi:Toprim domain/CHC2 zinc finger